MSAITTKDGTEIFYKDWGPRNGQPIVFSHGWPLCSDAWDAQLLFFGAKGYRVIAHDRRGHGRSDQPWDGNTMDRYADDLKAIDKPTLIIHGDDDQIVPIKASAEIAATLVRDAILQIYEGGSHGLAQIDAAHFNADILAFVKA